MNNPQVHLNATRSLPLSSLLYGSFLSPSFREINILDPPSSNVNENTFKEMSTTNYPDNIVEEIKKEPLSFAPLEKETVKNSGSIIATGKEGKIQQLKAIEKLQNRERMNQPDSFLLRAVKTMTRLGGPKYAALLGAEIAGPGVYRSMQSLAHGKIDEAMFNMSEAAIKGATAVGIGKIGEKLGENVLGGIPLIGKPMGGWLGWVVGSSMGERIGEKIEKIVEKLKAPTEKIENIQNSERFYTKLQNYQHPINRDFYLPENFSSVSNSNFQTRPQLSYLNTKEGEGIAR
ncbi:hypothetical protein A946_09985 [Methylacidiphilum kamchatkense Kam1]|uniref:Uncharacterized protein n=1 Tax=Methylacidiphilum kamchatkense Kam1 TaxID=1202785 RepID=A0A0C1UMZ8_9BACT|nr:hypothetical protein [Methylacidiphilum kamchatkense]KIE57969.1 hypothetical protein A946_09985 [Methylacidiphilum kamchatkense Kam1]QDQ42402.1 hypothetical protein kam1_1174 [Methylacidiphilum kamchatkense Kam1]